MAKWVNMLFHALDAALRQEAHCGADRGQPGNQHPHRVPIYRRLVRERRSDRRGIGSRQLMGAWIPDSRIFYGMRSTMGHTIAAT